MTHLVRLLADRREELTRAKIQTVTGSTDCRPNSPRQVKRAITTGQAKTILASVRPRDLAGKTRRRLTAEQLTALVLIKKQIKTLTKELKAEVLVRGSTQRS